MKLVVLVSAFLLWLGHVGPAWAERPAPDLQAGEAAYQQHCARCHGATGAGDGLDAKRFYPRPRDLRLGIYKFRTTASGSPPTDEDLFRTLTRGLPGSNMPDWMHLDEATRWQLVEYLKSLSSFFEEGEPEPVPIVEDPGPAQADLARGEAVYAQLQCASCHGAQGRANGMSAAGLVDDWDMAIRPVNLTQGWSYRGWSDPESIMLRVLTGIDGAGMPSYMGAVSPEDAWHLAYYVASLQEEAVWNRLIRATRLDGELPRSLDDPRWESAERTDVRLRNTVHADGTWVAPPTVTAVSIQVVYNDDAVALRTWWDDPTQDQQDPTDAMALLLRPQGVRGDTVTLQAWPRRDAPPLDICYWSADQSQGREVIAQDFDLVMNPTGAAPLFFVEADYQDGRWRLLLQRPRTPARPAQAAHLTGERFAPIAVAVWDGGNPNVRAVSSWIDVAFDEDAGD